mgnify:CR=1 FL=1
MKSNKDPEKDILRQKAVASAATIWAWMVDNEKIIRNLYNNMLWFDISSRYPFFTVAIQNLATQCIPVYNVEIKTKEEELVLQIFLEDVIERAIPLFTEHKQRMINAVRKQMEGK